MTNHLRIALLASVAFAAPVAAQETSPDADVRSVTDDVITVTARFREETVQDIGASVAGISESPSGAHDRSPMRNAWKHTPRSCSVPRSHRNRWSEHFKEAAVFICISTRSKRRTVSTTNTCRIYMGALQRLRKGKRCFIIEPDESHVQGAVLTQEFLDWR